MTRSIISVLKLILAILLLPVVIFASINFFAQLNLVGETIYDFFLWGIFSFLILYHFIYAPEYFYRKGQDGVLAVFKFFSPLVKIASFCLPIYTILFLIILGLDRLVFENINITRELCFLISFSLTFHMIFTASAFKTNTADTLRATYFFSMQMIYLVNLFIIAFCFHYFFENFSFIDFFNNAIRQTVEIYKLVFVQFFIAKS
ncbi:MAG: hypothetical protein ABH954_05985 [Candidatus Omnitrophota bacterium]